MTPEVWIIFIDQRRDSVSLALVAVLLAVFSTGPSLAARQKRTNPTTDLPHRSRIPRRGNHGR